MLEDWGGTTVTLSSPDEVLSDDSTGSTMCTTCCQRSRLLITLSVVCLADFLGL